jgi:hypothetical protein
MPRVTEIGWLVKFDPQGARGRILEQLTACDGNVTDASVKLGLSSRMLRRIINELGLTKDLANLRKRLGINWEREAPIRARAIQAGEQYAKPARSRHEDHSKSAAKTARKP